MEINCDYRKIPIYFVRPYQSFSRQRDLARNIKLQRRPSLISLITLPNQPTWSVICCHIGFAIMQKKIDADFYRNKNFMSHSLTISLSFEL